MPVSAIQSGYQMLQQSSQLADNSSRALSQPMHSRSLPDQQERNQSSISKQENPVSGNNNLSSPKDKPSVHEVSPDKIHAAQQLNQAKQYARIGTNLIQRDQDMIGSLLNTRA